MAETTYPIRKRFDTFNRLYFDGKMPRVRLSFPFSMVELGCCRFKRQPRATGDTRSRRRRSRRHVPGSIRIYLNRHAGLSHEELDGVLMHEMIHAWLVAQDKIGRTHGALFAEKRQMLQAVSGLHIIRCQTEPKPKVVKAPDRLVALCWFDEGSVRACAFAWWSCVKRARPRFSDEWRWFSDGCGELRVYDLKDPQATELSQGHTLHRPRGLVTRRGRPTVSFAPADERLARIPERGEPLFTVAQGDVRS